MGAIAWLDGSQLLSWLVSIPVAFVGLAWCEGTCNAGDRFRGWLAVLVGTVLVGTIGILALDWLAIHSRAVSILIRVLAVAVVAGLVILDVLVAFQPPRALAVPAVWLTVSLFVPAIVLARRPLAGSGPEE
jgi:hypothetical protein